MRKLASILVLLFLAVAFVTAQTSNTDATKAQPKTQESAAVAGPVMTFDVESIDYGTIQQGADPVRIFKFTNTGTEPLIIKNAQGSCGCTVPSYSTAPVLPGESSEIKVKYDTNRIGKFSKRVTLTTNANPETKVLTISGEVLKKDQPASVPAGSKNVINNNNN